MSHRKILDKPLAHFTYPTTFAELRMKPTKTMVNHPQLNEKIDAIANTNQTIGAAINPPQKTLDSEGRMVLLS